MKTKTLILCIALLMCIALQYGTALDFIGNVFPNESVPTNFASYWNQVTSENGGKWGTVEPVRDQYSWLWLDASYNYAKAHGIPYKEHTFVWGNQEPSWLGSLSDSEKRAEVEEWIRDYGNRYPDTDMIDVVNEPLHAPPSFRNALGGSGSTGWDWVVWTFEKARQYCPNAKLHINDYGIISDPGAANNYVNLINILKSKGLIDGIGIQCHSFNMDGVTTNTMNQVLNTLAGTGLPIYVSELDITGDDNTQLQRYKDKFPVLAKHSSVKGITFWGYIQGSTWKADAWLMTTGGSQRPALQWLKDNYLLKTDATPAPLQTPIPTDVPTPTPLPQNAYDTVEAEIYVDMRGLQVESCSEGGVNVGYIENGDYSAYMIDFTNGSTQIQVRAATQTSGGKVDVRLDSPTGELIGSVNIGGTGGWQSWQTFTGNVQNMNGLKKVYMVYTGGSGFLFNVNWFKFTEGTGIPSTPVPHGKIGDVDNNGVINIVDALLVSQYYVDLNPPNFHAEYADTNCDGSITIVDALLIAQYYVDLISQFC